MGGYSKIKFIGSKPYFERRSITTVSELLEDYREEQKDIVKANRNGSFGKTQHLQIQIESWEHFLYKRFEIEKTKKHRDELLDFLIDKLGSEYVNLRNTQYADKKEKGPILQERVELFENFDNKLFGLGLINKKTTKEKIEKWVRDAYDEEALLLANGHSGENTALFCSKTYPIFQEYAESLRNATV